MKALYFDTVPGTENHLNYDVTNINGIGGTYGKLYELVATNADYFWGSWCECDSPVPCAGNNINSMVITDPNSNNYNATTCNFVGGRPVRPIAR